MSPGTNPEGDTVRIVFDETYIKLEEPGAVLASRGDVNEKLVAPSPYKLIFVEIVKVNVFAAPGHGVDCPTFLVMKDGACTLRAVLLSLSQDELQLLHGEQELQAAHPQNGKLLEPPESINWKGTERDGQREATVPFSVAETVMFDVA